MRNLKSVLALIVALCLMLCLAVPALATEATETTTAATGDTTTAATDDTKPGVEVDATGDAITTGEEEHDHDHSEDEILSTDDIVIEEEEDSAFVKVIRIVLLVLEVIASVALIVVVLLQSGKEAGLSGALSGNSDSYMNKSGKGGLDKALASATKWIALAWILITLFLALI